MFPPPSPPSLTHSETATHVPISAAGMLLPLVFVFVFAGRVNIYICICLDLISSIFKKCISEVPVVMTCRGQLMAAALDEWPRLSHSIYSTTNHGQIQCWVYARLGNLVNLVILLSYKIDSFIK